MGPKRAGAILGVHRDTLRNRRDEALALIVEGLNRNAITRVRTSRGERAGAK
jgi:hypothetical protein